MSVAIPDDREIVDRIHSLHALGVPVATIAKAVKVRPVTVRYVLNRHRLPQQDLPLYFVRHPLDAQPAPDRVSER